LKTKFKDIVFNGNVTIGSLKMDNNKRKPFNCSTLNGDFTVLFLLSLSSSSTRINLAGLF
jgi:hypothetical protein